MKVKGLMFVMILLLLSSFAFSTTDNYFISDIVSGYYLNDTSDTLVNVVDSWGSNDGTLYGKTFNDGTNNGATLNNNLTGTITGATWNTSCTLASGKVGNCLEFDGVDDNIKIANNNAELWNNLNDRTYCTTFKINAINPASHQVIIGEYYSLNMATYMFIETDGRFLTLTRNGGVTNSLGSSQSLTAGIEYQGCVVVDNTTRNLYLNGVSVGSDIVVSLASSDSGIYIGARDGGTSPENFNGTISDVIILDKALSSTEVLSLYETGNVNTTDYYHEINFPLDEGTGTEVYTTEGKFGGMYSFNSTTYITVVDTAKTVYPDKDFTINFKANMVEAPEGYMYGIRNAGVIGGYDGFNIQYKSDGWLYVSIVKDNGAGSFTEYGKKQRINFDNWNEISVTHDSSESAIDLYVDGVKATLSGFSGTSGTPTDTYFIGISRAPGLIGSMDEFKIWNRILSVEELEEEATANAVANPEGIVAYYDFNERNGTVAYDNNQLSTGARQSTSNLDEPAFSWDKAMNFDGVDDTIDLGTNFGLPGNSYNWTYSVWFKASDYSYNQQIFGDKYSSKLFLTFGSLYCVVSDSSSSIESLAYILPETDVYYHTAITSDGTTLKMYVNGEVVSSRSFAGDMRNQTANYQIGSRSGENNYLKGYVQELRVYDRALTQDEISTLYLGLKRINIYTNSTGSDSQLQNWTIQTAYGNYVTTSNNATLDVPYGDIEVNFTNAEGFYNKNVTLTITDTDDYYIQIQDATPTFIMSDYATGFTFKLEGENTYSEEQVISGDITLNLTANNYYASILNGSTTLVNYTVTIPSGTNNINLSSFDLNEVYYYDQQNSSPIVGNNITITYPNSNALTYVTDSLGRVQFPTYNNESIQTGNYTITFDSLDGYESPLNSTYTASNLADLPFNVTYNVSRVGIKVNIFYRINGSVFTNLADISLQGVGNVSTSTGTYTFDGISLASGDYVLQAYSDGYFTEQRTITFDNQENISVNFYLLESNLTSANTLKVNVVDITQSKVDNAEVNLLEYDSTTLSYKSVSQCYTDADGLCKFLIELNDKTYKYTASKTIDGSLLTASSGDEGVIFREDIAGGSTITFSELEVTLVLQDTETYTFLDSHYLRYNVSENFNDTTNISTVSVDFQTTDGSTTKVCVQFFNTDTNPDTSEFVTCVESNAGTVTPLVPFTLNRSKNYRLVAYQIGSDGSSTNLDTFYYKSDTSLQANLKLYAILSPFILFLWIVIIAVAMFSGVLPILVVLGVILSIAEVVLFPNYMIASGMVLKLIILMQIFYFGRKKEDFE